MAVSYVPEKSKVTICLNCGDKGFLNAFVYCVKCLKFGVRRYCLEKVTFKEFVYWVCDDCEDEEKVVKFTPHVMIDQGTKFAGEESLRRSKLLVIFSIL